MKSISSFVAEKCWIFFKITTVFIISAWYSPTQSIRFYVNVGANCNCLNEEFSNFAVILYLTPLPNNDQTMPFAIAGDDAFPFCSWIKPDF